MLKEEGKRGPRILGHQTFRATGHSVRKIRHYEHLDGVGGRVETRENGSNVNLIDRADIGKEPWNGLEKKRREGP